MILVVVESPTKAKTLGKYLGADYSIVASMGHIRDLPAKEGSVNPTEDFAMKYQVSERAQKNVTAICNMAKKAKSVILATDPDREGEAIAWHIAFLLKDRKIKTDSEIKRASFSEVTPKAVKNAIESPRDIDQHLVDAQMARLALDYLVGYNLSPVLWHKCPPAKSAGRVQSVALEIIAEREAEIKSFKPQEYWTLDMLIKSPESHVESQAKVVLFNERKLSHSFPSNKEEAREIEDAINTSKKCKVKELVSKDFKQNPPPPFITSTLQQEALRKLGFTSARTMKAAQKLYEGVETPSGTMGVITYMRTDGTYISEDAIKTIRTTIETKFGNDFLPKQPVVYKNKVKNAQEAHEAIRVTNPHFTPADMAKYLDSDGLKLYSLIWKRTLACQMLPAQKVTHSARFAVIGANVEALISVTNTKFQGFLAVYNDKNVVDEEVADDDSELSMKEGQEFDITKVISAQKFTIPPARYNEASLIKRMEELGVGRPSTYATIISIIQDRGYVLLNSKQFHATPIGMLVAAFLKKFFTQYVEYGFTAKMEEELDEISDGKEERISFLSRFWKPFIDNVKLSENVPFEEVNTKVQAELERYLFPIENGKADTSCKKCSTGVMNFHTGKYGPYLRCSDYPVCNNTVKLGAGDSASQDIEPLTLGDATITLKTGPYGRYIEVKNGEKKKNVTVPKDMKDIDDEMIKKLASLPIVIGQDPATTKEIIVNVGRYGPYVGSDNRFASIKSSQIFSITPEEAIEAITQQVIKAANKKANEKVSEKSEKKTTTKAKTKK